MSVRSFYFLFAKRTRTHSATPAALCGSCPRSPRPRSLRIPLPASRLASPGDAPGCRGLRSRGGQEARAALGAELLFAAGEAIPTSSHPTVRKRGWGQAKRPAGQREGCCPPGCAASRRGGAARHRTGTAAGAGQARRGPGETQGSLLSRTGGPEEGSPPGWPPPQRFVTETSPGGPAGPSRTAAPPRAAGEGEREGRARLVNQTLRSHLPSSPPVSTAHCAPGRRRRPSCPVPAPERWAPPPRRGDTSGHTRVSRGRAARLPPPARENTTSPASERLAATTCYK